MPTLIQEFLENNVNDWGGYQEAPGRGNDNAVLFLVHGLWELYIAGEDIELIKTGIQHWHKYMVFTNQRNGVFMRTPGGSMLNSHDNYTGMAAGCELWYRVHGERCPWNYCLMKLSKRWWNYSSLREAWPPWQLVRGQLKPNDIGFIKLICSDQAPNWLERQWLLSNAKRSHSWNLHRLRGIVLTSKGSEDPTLKRTLEITKEKIDFVKAIKDYYGADSVIGRAIEKNEGRWEKRNDS